MTGALPAGLVAGFGVALPLGAIGTYLIGLGSRERFAVATAAALGVASTDGLFAVLASVGGVSLAGLVRPVVTPLSYLAAGVLVLLAIRTVVRAVRPPAKLVDAERLTPLRSYLGLLALTAVNPTTLIYFVAIVLGGQSRGLAGTLATAVLFPLGVFAASASWQLVLVGGGLLLGRTLNRPAGRRAVAAVSGLIMLALAANLLVG